MRVTCYYLLNGIPKLKSIFLTIKNIFFWGDCVSL